MLYDMSNMFLTANSDDQNNVAKAGKTPISWEYRIDLTSKSMVNISG